MGHEERAKMTTTEMKNTQYYKRDDGAKKSVLKRPFRHAELYSHDNYYYEISKEF